MALDAKVPMEDVTYRVIGCAMKVHNQLGPGLTEMMYHRALSRSMDEAGLSFEEQKCVEVAFEGKRLGLLYLDYLVEKSVVVEEKALSHLLTAEEVAQVVTYLAATGLPVGLLLNFGRSRLQYKRILRPTNVRSWPENAGRYLRKRVRVRA